MLENSPPLKLWHNSVMSLSDPLIGRQLDNYRIERLLGQGGMASVYYGVDIHLQRPAAIKVIAERYRDLPDYADRFLREARAMASWRHPNIPQVYNAGVAGDLVFYAMEYIQGLDLETLFQEYAHRGELMPHADVLRVGRALAEALDYAHNRGTIHRDVKPSNVLVSGDGRILLTDFGLLLQAEYGTRGEVFGSPHYIAPEQARNSAAAVPESDIYSLGVILYRLLVGVLPFDDPSPTGLALKHISEPPPSPRRLNPALDSRVEAILLKALSKLPGDRYRTGKELLDALEEAVLRPAGAQAVQPTIEQTSPSPPATLPIAASAGEALPRTISRLRIDDLVARELSTPPTGPLDIPAVRRASPGSRRRAGGLSGKQLGCTALVAVVALLFVTGAAALIRSLSDRDSRSSTASLASPTARSGQGSTRAPAATIAKMNVPATVTPAPTATFTPEPTPIQGDEYRVLLVSNKDDSLFLINQGDLALPLTYLHLGNEKGWITGSEWGVESLGPGQCVAVWKEEGKPQPPKDTNCDPVGAHLERSGSEKFWTDAFEVFYQGTSVGRCAGKNKPCTLRFQSSL